MLLLLLLLLLALLLPLLALLLSLPVAEAASVTCRGRRLGPPPAAAAAGAMAAGSLSPTLAFSPGSVANLSPPSSPAAAAGGAAAAWGAELLPSPRRVNTCTRIQQGVFCPARE
jgi:hypothetical protein